MTATQSEQIISTLTDWDDCVTITGPKPWYIKKKDISVLTKSNKILLKVTDRTTGKKSIHLLYRNGLYTERFSLYTSRRPFEKSLDAFLINKLGNPKFYYVPIKSLPFQVDRHKRKILALWRSWIFTKSLQNQSLNREQIIHKAIEELSKNL